MTTLQTFYIEDAYPDELKPMVRTIDKQKGFFLNLPEIPGAVEAMSRLRSIQGVAVKICTSPVPSRFCMAEKYLWVRKHLGAEWISDLIQIRDKTIIRAQYLIDDRPEIKGLIKEPSFEHILYRQSYNEKIRGKRFLTWNDYEWLIDELTHD